MDSEGYIELDADMPREAMCSDCGDVKPETDMTRLLCGHVLCVNCPASQHNCLFGYRVAL